MRYTERDGKEVRKTNLRGAVEFIARQGYCSRAELAEVLFRDREPGAKLAASRRVVQGLKQEGLVRVRKLQNSVELYSVSSKGKEVAEYFLGELAEGISKKAERAVRVEHRLATAGLCANALGLGCMYLSEYELYQRGGHCEASLGKVPDVLTVEVEQGRLKASFHEVELSHRNKAGLVALKRLVTGLVRAPLFDFQGKWIEASRVVIHCKSSKAYRDDLRALEELLGDGQGVSKGKTVWSVKRAGAGPLRVVLLKRESFEGKWKSLEE